MSQTYTEEFLQHIVFGDIATLMPEQRHMRLSGKVSAVASHFKTMFTAIQEIKDDKRRMLALTQLGATLSSTSDDVYADAAYMESIGELSEDHAQHIRQIKNGADVLRQVIAEGPFGDVLQ